MPRVAARTGRHQCPAEGLDPQHVPPVEHRSRVEEAARVADAAGQRHRLGEDAQRPTDVEELIGQGHQERDSRRDVLQARFEQRIGHGAVHVAGEVLEHHQGRALAVRDHRGLLLEDPGADDAVDVPAERGEQAVEILAVGIREFAQFTELRRGAGTEELLLPLRGMQELLEVERREHVRLEPVGADVLLRLDRAADLHRVSAVGEDPGHSQERADVTAGSHACDRNTHRSPFPTAPLTHRYQ